MVVADEGAKARAAAIGRIPSGLFVVTARHGVDETGMLASWVQQCSFEPLLISFALGKSRPVGSWLTPGASFTVNILAEDQTEFLVHFGKGFEPGTPAFSGLEVERPDGAAPVLCAALAYLDCRVEARHSTGDHDIVIGRVVAGRVLDDGRPMVHVRKQGTHY
jgi:flavin reductase (DIM6/NTAB) family NADH-FMN oxidoreductase RutF